MAQNIAEERGRWERGEGKGSGNGVMALSAASVDSEDPAANARRQRPPEPMGVRLISPSSNFHCSTAQRMMTTTFQDYVAAEMMLNTGTEDTGTCVWVASSQRVLLGLMFTEPPASGRWASDIRRSDLPGLCR